MEENIVGYQDDFPVLCKTCAKNVFLLERLPLSASLTTHLYHSNVFSQIQ